MMRMFWALVGVMGLAFLGVAGWLQGDPGRDEETRRIAALVQQLGDEAFGRREAAAKELKAVGEPALPALFNALVSSPDLEIVRRSQIVVRAILPPARGSKATGLELMLIDAGAFIMGSTQSEANRRADEPVHPVRIRRPFYLGAHEVTQAQFAQVMKFNPSWFAPNGNGKGVVQGQDTGRFPVEDVSWFDAVDFCNRLSALEGLKPYYQLTEIKRNGTSIQTATAKVLGGNGYRLPTEAEWEYGCRAGGDLPFHYGKVNTGREANIKALLVPMGYGAGPKWQDLKRPTKVGSYPANGWGLHDMHGNVAEWCWDWYDKDYYPNSPKDDPQGPAQGFHRVQRGGSWLVGEGSCRAAHRFGHTPGEGAYFAGFRVARDPWP